MSANNLSRVRYKETRHLCLSHLVHKNLIQMVITMKVENLTPPKLGFIIIIIIIIIVTIIIIIINVVIVLIIDIIIIIIVITISG